jgi:hypothetical protein
MTLRPTFPLDGSAGYGAEWLRAGLELTLREGVIGAGDFKVTAAAAGGMRVDVAAGLAVVKGDTGTSGIGLTQGLYLQPNDASIANAVTVTASHATLPRVDQIVLTVSDSSDLGSAGDTPSLAVVTGTATTGATLDNRTGAAALPSNTLRLADVLVPAASSAVTAGNIRDRRPWGAGTEGQTAYTSGMGVLTNTVTVVPGTPVRVELGAGQQMRVDGVALVDPGSAQWVQAYVYDNGAAVGYSGLYSEGTAPGSPPVNWGLGTATAVAVITTAGSHLVDLRLQNSASTGGLNVARLLYRVTNAPAGSN